MKRPGRSLQLDQAKICLTLLLGLGAYLIMSLILRAQQIVLDPANLVALDRAALQLFMPYLGIAVGGLFGTGQLSDAEPDTYRFWIAMTTLVIWDLVVVAHVLLIILGIQVVEDFIRFADTTLPVMATLVAAIMAHYFGAQPGKAPGRRGKRRRPMQAPGRGKSSPVPGSRDPQYPSATPSLRFSVAPA